MEFYGPPFESRPEPDETGSVEDNKKKKKKTTRIPKSSGILPKLEAEETKADKGETDKPENVLEKLFAKEADKDKTEDKAQAEKAEITAPETVEEGEEVIPEQSFETLEEEPADLPDSLEGEFAEEGTIISRAEAPKTEANEAVDNDTTSPEKPAAEPAESPRKASEAKEASIDFESPAVEPVPVVETVSHEQVIPPRPNRSPMIDPSAAYEREFVASRERKEASEPSVTLSEHEDEVYRARKRATTRGVWAGGMFGYWLGRRGRKAAEKEAALAQETVHKQDKKIERLEAEQAMAAERFRNFENTKTELINHTQTAKQSPSTPETIRNAENIPAYATKEAISPKPEQAPEEQPITEETYQTSEGRRVETSSWHRYEVDEKTGKVIENPELAYGEEFKKEQKQEKLQRPATEPHVAVQLGTTVVQHTDTEDIAQLKSAADKPKPEVKTGLAIFQDKAYIKQQFIRRTTNPVTWIVALGLVVLLFVVGIL